MHTYCLLGPLCLTFECKLTCGFVSESVNIVLMLVSTRILYQKNDRVMDWRVVSIPDEDSRSIDMVTLFFRILDHV